MPWAVFYDEALLAELSELAEPVQDALLATVDLLTDFGPSLGRPHVDTLVGSKHANMKEPRFRADGGVWRAAFAFDPKRQAVVLVAGNKAGVLQGRFYKRLITLADRRFDAYLARTEEA